MLKKAAVLLLLVAVSVLGYGYWHASVYGWLTVTLRDLSTEKLESVKNARLLFYNADGEQLAEGRSDADLGVVYLKHPQAGYCVEEASRIPYGQRDPKAWRQCYESQAKWIAGWAQAIKYVDMTFGNCDIRRIPVKVSLYNSSWWSWWIPLPHGAGEPVSHFSVSVNVDGSNCSAEDL
jgi:hypothetical protein